METFIIFKRETFEKEIDGLCNMFLVDFLERSPFVDTYQALEQIIMGADCSSSCIRGAMFQTGELSPVAFRLSITPTQNKGEYYADVEFCC